jgi:hypothetical protein
MPVDGAKINCPACAAPRAEDVDPRRAGGQRGVGPSRSSKTADIDKKRLVMIILARAGSGACRGPRGERQLMLLSASMS